ncbi:YTH domain-containing protein ECT1-like [Oryza brachyantha]|uniref:YTH domain-containing family protein n=1 Tax=Oryza brachyantha TaxID=4533 RepID=J3MV75_ORYBR|nr:YTH domain-containing protein ECT1-like [Oryza brachyantha]
MESTHSGSERPGPMDSQEPRVEVDSKTVLADNPEEQTIPRKDEKAPKPTISNDPNDINLPSEGQAQAGTSNIGGGQNAAYPQTLYSSQAQPFYYQGPGYENPSNEWDGYPPYVSVEGLEAGPPVVYNDDPSMMFHGGYGYDPYAHYSPISTPVPAAVSGDGQLYSPQQFSFSAPYYQQSVPPGMPYLSSPTPISQGEAMVPIDPTQGAFIAETLSPNSFLFGPRPEWFRSSEGNGSFPSPAASPQPVGGVSGPFGQSNFPMASGMQSPQHRPFYGFGTPGDSYGRGFSHGGYFPQATNYGAPFPSFGLNGRNSIPMEKGRRRGRGNALLCSCNGSLDFLNEQSRGPRATRPKKQAEDGSKDEKPSAGGDCELYNRPDFVTEYKNARFFIIKSYSEDNVHKSIKYGVWASTTNGNKKLDSAYREAKEKEEHYPIFLLFSVNASAQFCGVAEMIGPVDFEKSVDYWQQDKWTGQFPVKWHIVKDVPNNLFRHIILENNDNKPVTNSRDTQEVKLEQGMEMLKIFKDHEEDASILDDFDFYEERERALLENKARLHQQHQLPSSTAVEPKKPLTVSTDLVGHITKSFVQAVRLGEAKSVSPNSTEKSAIGDSSAASVKPLEVKESSL